MIVGIDGSNIRTGGGLTHLTNVLASGDPPAHGIEQVIVWSSRATIDRLPSRPWLEKIHEPMLDRALPARLYWQQRRLRRLAKPCDVLFSPGGNAPSGCSPLVTMSRNMLPFEYEELFRYGVSLTTLRLLLLRHGQSRTFRRADGMIFLTEYARKSVCGVARVEGPVAVVPHGVEERFRSAPRSQKPIESYSLEDPFRLLYISIVDVYKHQWHVAEAVKKLRDQGLPVVIDFVGPSHPRALRRLEATLARLDPQETSLRYRGPVPFEDLHVLREEADLFLFASSCENMPNILLEAMASGFPIACASRGPMPEILGDGGSYFDPERPAEIAATLRELVSDPALRARCAAEAFDRAAQYSWTRCANKTFDFIRAVAAGEAPRVPTLRRRKKPKK